MLPAAYCLVIFDQSRLLSYNTVMLWYGRDWVLYLNVISVHFSLCTWQDGQKNEREVDNSDDAASANQKRMNADPLEVMLSNMGYRITNVLDDDGSGEREGGEGSAVGCRASWELDRAYIWNIRADCDVVFSSVTLVSICHPHYQFNCCALAIVPCSDLIWTIFKSDFSRWC